ncbi:MAG: hypothetical protein WCO86_15865 [Planctomycetota bacterium]
MPKRSNDSLDIHVRRMANILDMKSKLQEWQLWIAERQFTIDWSEASVTILLTKVVTDSQ